MKRPAAAGHIQQPGIARYDLCEPLVGVVAVVNAVGDNILGDAGNAARGRRPDSCSSRALCRTGTWKGNQGEGRRRSSPGPVAPHYFIEARAYDVFSARVRVPTWQKMAVAARVARPGAESWVAWYRGSEPPQLTRKAARCDEPRRCEP